MSKRVRNTGLDIGSGSGGGVVRCSHTTGVKLHEGQLGSSPWAAGGVEESSAGC